MSTNMVSEQLEEPIIQNIKHLVGDDITWYIELDGWDYSSWDYVTADISGGTISMYFYSDDFGGTETSFSPISGSLVTDGTDGLAQFVFADDFFTSTDAGTYFYEVLYTSSGGDKKTPVRGLFILVN